MNQDNSGEMRAEYDMRGGVRGKYLARYKKWTSITSASGPVNVSSVTSTGEESGPKFVPVIAYCVTYVSPRAPRTVSVDRIAPEESTTAAHAR